MGKNPRILGRDPKNQEKNPKIGKRTGNGPWTSGSDPPVSSPSQNSHFFPLKNPNPKFFGGENPEDFFEVYSIREGPKIGIKSHSREGKSGFLREKKQEKVEFGVFLEENQWEFLELMNSKLDLGKRARDFKGEVGEKCGVVRKKIWDLGKNQFGEKGPDFYGFCRENFWF